MNKVILTGNICRDIELTQTASGKEFVNNVIAVQRDFKNAQGEYESDFINFVAWGTSAQYLNNYASKGDRVEIVGRWEVSQYETEDGEKRTANKCQVESIKAFSKQKTEDEQKEPVKASKDYQLPF